MKYGSYWLDMPYTPRAPLGEDIETDVVVIGAGITGVSTAYHCTKAGYKTILIEKETVASGSAGKNGGMVVEGLHIDFSAAAEQFGQAIATEAWQRTIDAKEHVAALILEHKIDCDYSKPGSLYVASDEAGEEMIRTELDARKKAGFSGELVSQFMPKRHALFLASDYLLHPVKFVRGLAQAAEKDGLVIYEHTNAVSFDMRTVVTPQGTIRAKTVIVAIESNKTDLQPSEGSLTRELVVVTEPFSSEDMSALEWNKGEMFWNTDSDYIAVRKIGNRLFLNGSCDLEPTQEDMDTILAALIKRFFAFAPHILEEKIIPAYCWTGLLLYPARNRPFVREKDGYYELFGNGGNGLTNGIMLGQMMAGSLEGREIPKLYR